MPVTLYNEFVLDPTFIGAGEKSPTRLSAGEASPLLYLDSKKPGLIMMGETCIAPEAVVGLRDDKFTDLSDDEEN